ATPTNDRIMASTDRTRLCTATSRTAPASAMLAKIVKTTSSMALASARGCRGLRRLGPPHEHDLALLDLRRMIERPQDHQHDAIERQEQYDGDECPDKP